MPPGRVKLVNRGVLAGALVQQCLAQHADRVQFHFEQVGGGRLAGACVGGLARADDLFLLDTWQLHCARLG